MIYRKSRSKNDIARIFLKIIVIFSRLNEGYRDEKEDTSDEDSVESTKTGEQETIN
jgi:hypothetical protein